jgi:Kef-type K+ transport system membrane component KefB
MKDFFEYVAKNKYVIICVTVVVVLYALGIVDFLTKAIILIALIAGAVFLGKKIQDNEEKIKDFFKGKKFKQEVYYYKENNDKK